MNAKPTAAEDLQNVSSSQLQLLVVFGGVLWLRESVEVAGASRCTF